MGSGSTQASNVPSVLQDIQWKSDIRRIQSKPEEATCESCGEHVKTETTAALRDLPVAECLWVVPCSPNCPAVLSIAPGCVLCALNLLEEQLGRALRCRVPACSLPGCSPAHARPSGLLSSGVQFLSDWFFLGVEKYPQFKTNSQTPFL